MSRTSVVRLLSVFVLASWASTLRASTITYAVGKCMPNLPSFPTISRALAAVPSPNVVEVCPGTYREQPEITHPVALEGVSNGTSARGVIAPPASGLVINATDDFGEALAVQLWGNASGPVTISNLTVDSSGNKVSQQCCTFVVGIFYQNSSGTVNRLATRNQSGTGLGVGIWAEGGSSNPLVTIENNSVRNYDDFGIQVETNSLTPELTAVIKGNDVTTSKPNSIVGIDIDQGTAVAVTSNLIVNPGFEGIVTTPVSTGSISANTVVNGSLAGIIANSDGVSVTSNKIFGATTGITFLTSVAAIQGNTITTSKVGIDFFCIAEPNVHSNIITDAGTALAHVPSAVATSNTYFNVGTIRTGGC